MRSLKFVTLLCVLVAGLAFSQESSQAPAKQSNLLLEADLGLSYAHYGYPSKEFDGLGPGLGIKFGGFNSSRTFGFFFTADYAHVFGSIDDDDASGYRFFLGLGTEFLPFNGGNSPMQDAFVGVSMGFMMIAADRNGQSMSDTFAMGSRSDIEEQGFSFAVELGKTWPVFGNWRLGFAVTAAVDLPIRFGEGTYESSLYSVGANIRISKK